MKGGGDRRGSGSRGRSRSERREVRTICGSDISGNVILKLGSRKFAASADVLRRIPDSYLAKLITAETVETDKDGAILIDRDPTHFQQVLNFVRSAESFVPPADRAVQAALLEEAEFYNLPGLAMAIPRTVDILTSHLVRASASSDKFIGGKYGGAVLSVEDPNNFSITLSLDGFDPLRNEDAPFFIGLGPASADLAEEWLSGDSPRAPLPELPSDDYKNVRDLQVKRALGEFTYPPAIMDGVFFASSGFLMKETSGAWPQDAKYNCYQFIKDGLELCECSRWSKYDRPPKFVRIDFLRGSEGTFAEFSFSKPALTAWKIDFEAEGIDDTRDYRPMIFFNKNGISVTAEVSDEAALA